MFSEKFAGEKSRARNAVLGSSDTTNMTAKGASMIVLKNSSSACSPTRAGVLMRVGEADSVVIAYSDS
ncbi:MAG: hypothetical protein KDD77_13130 [Caldilineaceae bacterium]|nr:hypothetical protein [Caldilineaceae bacterium]